jgi:hypothetical protein
LKKKEEQLNSERIGWEMKLKEKEEAVADMAKVIKEASAKLSAKDIAPGIASGINEKIATLERANNLFEKTAIIEPSLKAEDTVPAMKAGNVTTAEKRSLFTIIANFWRNMNEPVIVIGIKKNDGKKG